MIGAKSRRRDTWSELRKEIVEYYNGDEKLADTGNPLPFALSKIERLKSRLATVENAIRCTWAVDTEDGLFCQHCSAEIHTLDEDFNAGQVMSGEVEFSCEHHEDCVAASLTRKEQ